MMKPQMHRLVCTSVVALLAAVAGPGIASRTDTTLAFSGAASEQPSSLQEQGATEYAGADRRGRGADHFAVW